MNPSKPDQEPQEPGVSEIEPPASEVNPAALQLLHRKRCASITLLYEDFMKLTSLCTDISIVYRNRPIWTNYSVEALTKDPIEIYHVLPTSRPSVRNFIGLLIHESAHQQFSHRESNSSSNPNYVTVEEAVSILLDMVEKTIVKEKWSEQGALDILKWACELSCELHMQNNRRPCAVQMKAHSSGEQFLVLLKTVKSVNRLLSVINGLINILLEKCLDACLRVLFDVSSFNGVDFNWMWLHISDQFPSLVVDRLFEIGKESFTEYIKIYEDNLKTPMAPALFQSAIDISTAKMTSFSYLFTYLTNNKDSKLKQSFKTLLQEGLDSDTPPLYSTSSSSDSLSILFILRVIIDSPALVNNIVMDNYKLMTPSYLIRLTHHILSLPPGCLSSNWITDLDKLSSMFDIETISILMDTMLRTAFDPSAFSGFDATTDKAVPILRQGVIRILSHCVDILVRMAHKTPNLDGCPALAEFSNGDNLQELINWSLVNNLGRPPILQYLHAIAITFGCYKGAEIIARYIMKAKDESELGVMLSLLTSIHPFYPSIMSSVYEQFHAFKHKYYMEQRKLDDSYRNSLRWIDNLRVLLTWEMKAGEMDIVKSIGFYPGDKLGDILIDMLSMVIERMRCNVEKGDKLDLASTLLIISRFLSATGYSRVDASQMHQNGYVVHCPALTMKCLYKSAAQLATCLRFSLLLYGGGVGDKDGRDISEQLRLSILSFCHEKLIPQQSIPFYKVFVSSFIHGIIQDSEDLFKDSIDIGVYKLPSMERPSTSIDPNVSLIDEIRSLSLKQSVASLAHSGQIAPSKGRKRITPINDEDVLRLVSTMDILYSFCIPRSNDTIISRNVGLIAAKKIALSALDASCIDGLGEDYSFDDWIVEKEAIARYVEITRRVESSQLLQHILSLLSECKPSLWFVLPILKALLATLISSFEKAFDRSKKPSDILLDKADRWISLARRGEVLPEKMTYVMDMLPYVSCYDGFHLLSQIWKYFQKVNMSYDIVNEMHGGVIRNEAQEPLPPVEEFLEPFLLVAHSNISELGWVVPLICPLLIDDAIRSN